jgi:hypothetical protein
VIQPRYLDKPVRVKNPRVARAATQRRIVHKSRARYAGITRVSMAIGCLLVLFMGYVVLTSTLTGLSYAVARADQRREAILEETMRLDDRIASLRSDDRLYTLASRLGMKEPQRFAVVRPIRTVVAVSRPHLAMLSSLAGLLMPAVAEHR